MKKLLFGLVATLFFGLNVNAQEKFALDLTSKLSNESLVEETSTHKLIFAQEYSKKVNGTINVTGYVEDGIVKIKSMYITFDNEKSYSSISSKVMLGGCDGGYRLCARGCTDKSTETGVLLCTVYCVIDCAGL